MQKKEDSLETEFAEFFNFCKEQGFTESEMKVICEPLNREIRRATFKKMFIILFSCFLVVYLYNSVETFSWIVSAIGRIIMIKLLPVWDWTTLYNARCLIKRSSSELETKVSSVSIYETDPKNCILCEQYDQIDVLHNVTFSHIQRDYLEKGLPVLVKGSHEPEPLQEFLQKMREADKFVQSAPCDAENSLMLDKFLNIEDLLIAVSEQDLDSSWFFQLRNCEFRAVKDSRSFIAKPYYYSAHLEPFYSSWILMSNDFQAFTKELYLDGLVILQQITGKLVVSLTAKEPCLERCGEHSFVMKEGESLVFLTDLWIFSYTLNKLGESLTVITETHWST